MITHETRAEANDKVPRDLRYRQIIDILTDKELTAKEIAVEMYRQGMIPTSERNFAAPRLTELTKCGAVEITGKVKCAYTGHTVTTYTVISPDARPTDKKTDLKFALKMRGITYADLAERLRADGYNLDKTDISRLFYNPVYPPPNKDLVKAIENILGLKAFSLSVDKESVKSKNVHCNDAQMV